ncbi:LAMI_0H13014g1_1 [Lachancea mirantina]|uniref:LAMI_0H13014g1_1 n=1 Tax=Lachancea mirantina TaxID=1230905 RepID=A0A1G4KHK2_9SACH|nr:LAMI_0H13014g1_1 [Lachancea mirantina]
MTWRQFVMNALRKAHGLFGESCLFEFLCINDKFAYLKVNDAESELFSVAMTTYISTDELVGFPLVANIMQRTSDLKSLIVGEDDVLWRKKAIAQQEEENEC